MRYGNIMTHSVRADFKKRLDRAYVSHRDRELVGFVYVIAASNHPYVKIGVAECPATRRNELQCGNFAELVVKAAVGVMLGNVRKLEGEAHREARSRGHGYRGEWFECSPDEAIDCILTAADRRGTRVVSPPQIVEIRAEQFEEEFIASETARKQKMRRTLGMD